VLRELAGSLVIVCGLAASPAAADAAGRVNAYLELFTSQGCAACPSADSLLVELAQEDGVLAVSMPVKLWDFLGWADTLATDALTKRQMAYSVARGDKDVYTPQMIVNGKEDVLGSDEEAIRAMIAERGGEPLPLPISLASSGDVLSIRVGESAAARIEEATLWLLVVHDEVTVPVNAGENGGRTLTYHNVVRHLRPIGMWKGEAMSFDLPLADLEKDAEAGCVVIAQVETFKGPGRVVGAAKLERLLPDDRR
jgi:hypothetical protein